MRSVRAISVLHRAIGLAALLFALVGVFAFGAASASAYSLLRVACPSVSQCTAIDGVGQEVTFNPTAPGTPAPTTIDGSGGLHAVACPSVSQCTIVDEGGREVTFDPTGPGNPTPTTIDASGDLSAVACPAVSQCTAVDSVGREATFNPTAPGTPTPTTIGGSGSGNLTAVACPAVSQCTAVDGGGREVTFDPNAPGSAQAVMVDPSHFCGLNCHEGYVTGVACPSVSQCTAVDNAGREVTFDPTAPGKSSPSYVTVDSVFLGGLEAVACPSVSQCTAVDERSEAVTFDPNAPGSPTATPIDGELTPSAVACPSPAQCTAVDNAGGEVTFDPNAAGSAARTVIDGGGLVTTTTPTTGASPTFGGIAKAAGSGRVKHGVAAIRLTCAGSGACKGTIKLLASVAGKRAVYHHGRQRLLKRTHSVVVIGTASFSIAAGASIVVRVDLSRPGTALVLKAGRRGLMVQVGGSDVKTRLLVL